MKSFAIVLVLAMIGLSSCDSDSFDAKVGYDQAMLNYIEDHGWTAIGTPEGMYYVIEVPGGEEKPTLLSTITIGYKGYYSDDKVFDSNTEFSSSMGSLIEGWKIGIPKFGAGGVGHLLIPPSLAYGETPSNGVREQSILIFDVELKSF